MIADDGELLNGEGYTCTPLVPMPSARFLIKTAVDPVVQLTRKDSCEPSILSEPEKITSNQLLFQERGFEVFL